MPSVRPAPGGGAPNPPAITKWPAPPAALSKPERAAWDALGKSLVLLGAVSAADLLVVRRAAQVGAMIEGMLAEGDGVDTSRLAAMMRIEVTLLTQLGLTPQARRAVAPLKADKGKSRFADIA